MEGRRQTREVKDFESVVHLSKYACRRIPLRRKVVLYMAQRVWDVSERLERRERASIHLRGQARSGTKVEQVEVEVLKGRRGENRG